MISGSNYEILKEIAVRVLSLINPKLPFGTNLFNAIARITVGTAIEAVIFRNTEQGPEIFLAKRKPGGAYAGLWHCPGTFLRPGEAIEIALARLENNEKIGKFIKTEFAGFYNNLDEERGHTVHLIFSCETEVSADIEGHWFLVDDLPTDVIVEHHVRVVIPTAFKKFSV